MVARLPNSLHRRVLFVCSLALVALASTITTTTLPPNPSSRTHAPLDSPIVTTPYSVCKSECLSRTQLKPSSIIEPNCTTQWYCPRFFTPPVLEELCTVLCRNQYPSDCASAKFLVVTEEWAWGLGSNLHMQLILMTRALSENRVLMYSPDLKSLWTHAEDPDPLCADRKLECYFAPLTHCKLPDNWRDASPQVTMYASKFRVGNYSVHSKPHLPQQQQQQQSSVLQNMPLQWWTAQLAAFMFRPSQSMMDKTIAPQVRATFASNHGELPERLLSVFMRQGDKFLEATLQPAQVYWDRIDRAIKAYGISNVYLSSDGGAILKQILDEFAPTMVSSNVNFFVVPTASRPDKGLTMQQVSKHLFSKPKIRNVVDLALTDLYIQTRSIAWIGTLSSNWCRLINEMRVGHGRFGSTYESLDWSEDDVLRDMLKEAE